MGNCQAIDAAALVIQHPGGKIERMYWPIRASEVMRLNPGHYVSLIIPLPPSESRSDHHRNQEEEVHQEQMGSSGTVRFARVKLLRPNETLALGHAYRLVTTQEVMKVLRAKKYAKIKKLQVETLLERTSRTAAPSEKLSSSCEAENKENIDHATNHERRRESTTVSGDAAGAALRSKSWRPSLESISEAAS